MKYLFLFQILLVGLISCGPKKKYEVVEFKPMLNFNEDKDTLDLPMDLSDVISKGISIPSKAQDSLGSGYFKFSFKVVNNSEKPRAFRYKIFYHNDSYKFEEELDDEYNVLAANNFYGSWLNAKDSFHVTAVIPNDGNYHQVLDSFKIVGNPRDERKYFGAAPYGYGISDYQIDSTMKSILKDNGWYTGIKDKAAKNKITVESQMRKDAIWVLNEKFNKDSINNRWKRNPHVGCYSFTLAITPDEDFSKLSGSLKDISKPVNGNYIDPYYELFHKSNPSSLVIVKSDQVLRTKAVFELGSGIYIPESRYWKGTIDTNNFTSNCGWSKQIYNTAQFEQYFHNIDKSLALNNIPVSFDVAEGNYTREEYNRNKEKYSKASLPADYFQITDFPGKTVSSDQKNNKLLIKNPAGQRKEQVGLNSRIGLTYGKFIARIKFPAIISKDNVWNGLTCAYWLKYQEESDWNNRMICDSLGYLNKFIDGPASPRLQNTFYSEIDFEILKTSNYWPATSYTKGSKVPVDHQENNHDLMVTCTNWDLACKAPQNFSVGAKDFEHGNTHYITHRWDDWYKALTIKTPIEHDSLFNRPCYYEIEWRPDRIIWRIGVDRNHMMEVAYMDNTITSIPNNQMLVVFTQEFHHSQWWPLSPFLQELIPYPAKDIQGEIWEMVVE